MMTIQQVSTSKTMNSFVRLIAFVRYIVLRRDLKTVEKSIRAFNDRRRAQLAQLLMKEFAEAGKLSDPTHYADSPRMYAPWGTGTRMAMERMRSNNEQLKLRGIALWIVVAFNETSQSPYQELAGLHRELVRLSRELKSVLPPQAGSLQAA